MFCNACGAQLDDNVSFCTQCGSPVQVKTEPAFEPVNEQPTEPIVQEPVVEAMPVEEVPAFEAMPVEEVPAFEAMPVEEVPAFEAMPVEEVPVFEAMPVEEVPAFQAMPAEEVPAFQAMPVQEEPPVFAPAPAYDAPPGSAPVNEAISPKSRTATLILSIAVGTMGINRLYLGAKGGVSRLIMYIIGIICSALCSYIPLLCIVALPLLIIVMVGGIKDIIRSAKGTMVDGNGLPVKKW